MLAYWEAKTFITVVCQHTQKHPNTEPPYHPQGIQHLFKPPFPLSINPELREINLKSPPIIQRLPQVCRRLLHLQPLLEEVREVPLHVRLPLVVSGSEVPSRSSSRCGRRFSTVRRTWEGQSKFWKWGPATGHSFVESLSSGGVVPASGRAGRRPSGAIDEGAEILEAPAAVVGGGPCLRWWCWWSRGQSIQGVACPSFESLLVAFATGCGGLGEVFEGGWWLVQEELLSVNVVPKGVGPLLWGVRVSGCGSLLMPWERFYWRVDYYPLWNGRRVRKVYG